MYYKGNITVQFHVQKIIVNTNAWFMNGSSMCIIYNHKLEFSTFSGFWEPA